MRYTHRFQKLIRARIGLSFSPENVWQVKGITFRIQKVLPVRSGGNLGEIKAAAVIDDIVAFLTTAGLGLLYWVRILCGFGNLSGFGDRTSVLEFGEVGVWLVITEICDKILKVFVNSHKHFSTFHFGVFFPFASLDGEPLIEVYFQY